MAGGGSSSGEKVGDSEILPISPITWTVLVGTKCVLEFRVNAYDHKGEQTGNGSYEIKIGTNTIKGIAK